MTPYSRTWWTVNAAVVVVSVIGLSALGMIRFIWIPLLIALVARLLKFGMHRRATAPPH